MDLIITEIDNTSSSVDTSSNDNLSENNSSYVVLQNESNNQDSTKSLTTK